MVCLAQPATRKDVATNAAKIPVAASLIFTTYFRSILLGGSRDALFQFPFRNAVCGQSAPLLPEKALGIARTRSVDKIKLW
jgi:hypothetical protein